LVLLLFACAEVDDANTNPAASADELVASCVASEAWTGGWSEATHGADAEADYDGVFDPSVVSSLTITVAPSDYEAMYAELAELLGSEFGSGGGGAGAPGGGEPPGEEDMAGLVVACDGADIGDACEGSIDGEAFTGTCEQAPGNVVACVPSGEVETDFTSGDPSYVPVTVSDGERAWCGVGMRFKGNSTLSQTWSAGVGKLPFRFDFDKFEEEYPEVGNQRFFGFEELSLGNGSGDATLLRDVLASEILEDRGVPAARNAFRAVYLDAGEGPVYVGLYTMMEAVGKPMMSRVYGDDAGNLYEADGTCATLECADEASFDLKEGDDAGLAEVEGLVAALEDGSPDAAIDVDAFLLWLAVNSAMENWDSYGVAPHNYYLYANPADDGRLAFIPWDHNLALAESMKGEGDVSLDSIDESWPLIRVLLDNAEGRAAYEANLAYALDGAFAEATFEARVLEVADTIDPFLFGADAEIEGYSFLEGEEAYDDAIAELLEHAASRRAEVAASLAE